MFGYLLEELGLYVRDKKTDSPVEFLVPCILAPSPDFYISSKADIEPIRFYVKPVKRERIRKPLAGMAGYSGFRLCFGHM